MNLLQTSTPVPLARPLTPGPTQPFWVEVVESAAALESHRAAWQALAQNALEPNAFYEPWMLLPAIEAFAAKQQLLFALVYRKDPARPKGPPRLCGFFPFEARRRFKRVPLRVLYLWRHLHCFLCTPLLEKEHAREALETMLAWARKDARGAGLLDFPLVHGDGPFQRLLVELVNEQKCSAFTEECYHRALIERGPDFEGYLALSMSGGNRKELRRQRRRLTELGRFEARTLQDDVESWIEHFLTLEAQGWKGDEKTALGSSAAERAYFAAIARAAFERKQLAMLGLFLDDRPIALKCNFLSGDGGFAFKIAYDESFAKYSPGVQLELDNIQFLHEHKTLRWMDSCAVAKHFMINRLWRERRAIQSVLLSTGRVSSDLLVGSLPLLRTVKRLLRRGLKTSS